MQESTSSDGVDIWGLVVIQQLTIVPNKKILGKVFRKDQKILSESLEVTVSHFSFLVIALKRFIEIVLPLYFDMHVRFYS